MKTKLIIYRGCDNFIKILVNFVLNANDDAALSLNQ